MATTTVSKPTTKTGSHIERHPHPSPSRHATGDNVPVGGYVLAKEPHRDQRGSSAHQAERPQHRRPADPGRFALPLLRGQSRARVRPAGDARACAWTSPPAPPSASSRATRRKSRWSRSAGKQRVYGFNNLVDGWARRATPDYRPNANRGRPTRRGARLQVQARSDGAVPGITERSDRSGDSWRRDLAQANTPACSARPPATRSASATPTSTSRSSGTCGSSATRPSTAAARPCATAWAWTTSSPAPAARSTWSSPTSTVVDPTIGVVKADVGIKDGKIVGIGKAGNPSTMDGVTPGLAVGPGDRRHLRRAADPDRRPAWTPTSTTSAPQQVYAALSNGITTFFGGGIGPDRRHQRHDHHLRPLEPGDDAPRGRGPADQLRLPRQGQLGRAPRR